VFAFKGGAFFAMTVAVLGLMSGLLQINPIWNLGPYKPSQISAGSQPDFYMMWTDGLLRIWPPWEFYIGHHTVPQPVWIALLMGLIFVLLFAYPWVEKRATRDSAHHNLLQRPRDVPAGPRRNRPDHGQAGRVAMTSEPEPPRAVSPRAPGCPG